MLKTREHIALLTAMKTAGLALSLARSFSEDQLQTCCDRLNAAEVSVGSCREYGKLQSTLVENPGSIEHIRQLFDANISGFSIEEWLKAEAQTGCRLLDYPVRDLVNLFNCNFPSMQARQEYALYFMPEYADENARSNIIANIREFYMRMRRNIAGMSAGEREVFTHAFQPEYLSAVEDEMKTLFKARRIYAAFYNSLRIERTDERLLTLRQMLKRELLDGLNNDQVESVAARLSEKPFMAWKDSAFAHIAGLTPKQCVRLLYAYDSVKRFLPEIHTANEAAFLIRHGDKLEAFSDWNSVKKSIGEIDTAWEKLREELQLDDAFVREHEQEILNFLYQEGASIAMAYMNGVMEVEGFKRILRALLMGKYAELKYHADDLVREIGFPVTEAQKAVWMNNLSDSRGRLIAEERDDFFTIMRIGELPQRTCLNYADGAYRECLLSCFDSNKKFLYATMGGRPVARAMLRLTKGSAKKPGDKDTASLQFVDVLNECEEPVEGDVEKLVLFLERCYVSGISMEESEEVKRMFIELAMRKAREIGAEVVLSNQYRECSASMGFTAMQHYLYISKSKGGKQYLDSLGGSCNVTNEGSYRKEMVMILAGEGGKA